MSYRIVELKESETAGFAPRGAASKLWRCRDPEIMLSGPAETGKTWTCSNKLNALMWKYGGAQAVIVRKTQSSLYSSVVRTFKRVAGITDSKDSIIKPYGGQRPEWFDYPNGSRVWLGGMDNPNKVLSSERDFVYVCQAEELTVDDWEVLRTRNTGRGGVAPYAQQFADCNPGNPNHWIQQRKNAGKLTFLESRHEDNPTLYDEAGNLTEQGVKSLTILDSLTGVRYWRLRKGLWVGAEGIVYEGWDPAVHVIDRNDRRYGLQHGIPAEWPRLWVIDFGFNNPFVCQWWAIDPDGRMFRYREIYMSGKLVEDHAKDILAASKGEPPPAAIICDHDLEDRATLERYLGMPTKAAFKAVTPGIQAVAGRMRTAGDGKPRLLFLRDSLVETDSTLEEVHKPISTEQEIDGYIWDTRAGKRKGEQPLKLNDHGCDAARYAVAEVDELAPSDSKHPQLSPAIILSKWGRRR